MEEADDLRKGAWTSEGRLAAECGAVRAREARLQRELAGLWGHRPLTRGPLCAALLSTSRRGRRAHQGRRDAWNAQLERHQRAMQGPLGQELPLEVREEGVGANTPLAANSLASRARQPYRPRE